MCPGEKIGGFAAVVDAMLVDLKQRLPEDLVIARTSDQPLQVRENIDLFMQSLYKAIVLVVLVSLIGFWEWRSALLMAISISITFASCICWGLICTRSPSLRSLSRWETSCG